MHFKNHVRNTKKQKFNYIDFCSCIYALSISRLAMVQPKSMRKN